MKFLIFFYFCASFLPSWIRIRIHWPVRIRIRSGSETLQVNRSAHVKHFIFSSQNGEMFVRFHCHRLDPDLKLKLFTVTLKLRVFTAYLNLFFCISMVGSWSVLRILIRVDPHLFGRPDPDTYLREKVRFGSTWVSKAGFGFASKSKFRSCGGFKWGRWEPLVLKKESWSVCWPIVSHHFDYEPHPDPRQSEMSDPDQHQTWERVPDPQHTDPDTAMIAEVPDYNKPDSEHAAYFLSGTKFWNRRLSGFFRTNHSSVCVRYYQGFGYVPGIHLIRIRIQHFRLNTDPIRIHGLADKKLKKMTAEKKIYFGSITTIYLSLVLHKGRLSYRRSLQLTKETSSTSIHEIS